MKRLFLILILAGTACLHADDASAIINGPNYAFLISAPKGWKLTTTPQMPAAFHPIGGSIEKSPVIMYIRSGSKPQLGVSSIPELNALDLKGIRANHPGAQSRKIGAIKNSAGIEMPIYSFSGGGYSELVAYCEEGRNITIFVLSADTDALLKTARPAFDKLVSSYVAMDASHKPATKK